VLGVAGPERHQGARRQPRRGKGRPAVEGAPQVNGTRRPATFPPESRPTVMRSLGTVGVLVGLLSCAANSEDPGESATVCEQDALRCDGPVLQLCTDRGSSWAALEVCESAGHCDPGFGCRSSACVDGETRCNGYMFQACATDRADWEPVVACTSAATCDPLTGCE
jgi:hypothetical protein